MSTSRRNAAKWLESDSLSMSLPAVRSRTRLGAEYSEKCHVSPLSMFGHCFDVVYVDKTRYPHMLHLSHV